MLVLVIDRILSVSLSKSWTSNASSGYLNYCILISLYSGYSSGHGCTY